ncbi:MAG: lysophospholipase [Bacteroidia bacterium]|nr:lysophospholipase [Bacteroidia bacterium]
MQAEFFTTSLGTKLRVRKWLTPSAKADIFFVHGFAEHSNRYFNEAKFLNNLGLNFIAFDQRTHGESEGKPRAYIDNFDVLIKEYEECFNHQIDCKKPFFLMAHSMGGLVQLSFLLGKKEMPHTFKGACFSSPLIMPNKDMAPLLQKLSGIIAAILPKLKTVKLDPEHISRDPKEQKSYVEDPLNYIGGLYAKTADTMLKQMKKIHPHFSEFDVPFIIQHGTDDQLAEFEGSKTLFETSSSKDKTFIPLEEFRHEITREINHEMVLKNYGDWMTTRL